MGQVNKKLLQLFSFVIPRNRTAGRATATALITLPLSPSYNPVVTKFWIVDLVFHQNIPAEFLVRHEIKVLHCFFIITSSNKLSGRCGRFSAA